MMKCIQVNGIKIDSDISFKVKRNDIEYNFVFMDYSKYLVLKDRFINSDIINKCNTVVLYESMGNNSYEIHYIKILLSSIYFSYRISVEKKRREYLINEEKKYYEKLSDNSLKRIADKYESFFDVNMDIRGYWNVDCIEVYHWDVKLGRQKLTNDDFESYISRAYSLDLCDSYDKRKEYYAQDQEIHVDKDFLSIVANVNRMLIGDDVTGNKLKSAMRLYYDVFMIYTNMNNAIISISTIMETLLLEKSEDNQRKKVSVRAACIIYDGKSKSSKKNLANIIYQFYKFRNAIVHDGKSYLDFDEFSINQMVERMKHVIYELVRCYIEHKITDIADIKKIAKRNSDLDGLTKPFDYVIEEN